MCRTVNHLPNEKVSERKKKEFFDKCVEAFQSLTGDTREIYFCPLCGNGFTRKALQEKILTIEHVPPESLGGKELLLTCKRCNTTAGYKVDSALHSRERHHKLIRALRDGSDQYQGRVRLKMGDENLNFNLLINPGRKVEFRPAGNDPQAMERWQAQMRQRACEGTRDGLTCNVTTVHGFSEWLSRVGDLRVAYLLAFAAFGYRYAFDKRLDPIRHQLQNPEERKMNWFWKFLGWNEPRGERVLAIATQPVGLLYISSGNSAVFLPWLDGPINPYEELFPRFGKGENVSFSGMKIAWPDRLRLELDFKMKKVCPIMLVGH